MGNRYPRKHVIRDSLPYKSDSKWHSRPFWCRFEWLGTLFFMQSFSNGIHRQSDSYVNMELETLFTKQVIQIGIVGYFDSWTRFYKLSSSYNHLKTNTNLFGDSLPHGSDSKVFQNSRHIHHQIYSNLYSRTLFLVLSISNWIHRQAVTYVKFY